MSRVLGPVVAGKWYPADGPTLKHEIDRLMRETEPAEGAATAVRALVAPHAGYVYSGAVAARGFRQVQDASVRTVVLLGPSHYAAFAGASLPDADLYRTPLGDVELDADLVTLLANCPGFHVDGTPFAPEHSLEAEIPFLQRVLAPGWTLVPLLIGAASDGSDLTRIAETLASVASSDLLFVVSSDLTHFGRAFRYTPFDDEIQARIERLDMGAVERMLALDAAGFSDYVRETGATICGRMPIEILLRTLPRGTSGRLVSYDTSGRMTGDWDPSVSYASVVFQAAPAVSRETR